MENKLESKTIIKQADMLELGRIISNEHKIALLVELSKGDIPKSKAAEILKVTQSTINLYVKELLDLSLVIEYPSFKDKTHLVRMLKLAFSGISIDFKKIET